MPSRFLPLVIGTNIITAVIVANTITSFLLTKRYPRVIKHGPQRKKALVRNRNTAAAAASGSGVDEATRNLDLRLNQTVRFCEPWPLSSHGLPLGPSRLELVMTKSKDKCSGMSTLIANTFTLSYPNQKVADKMEKITESMTKSLLQLQQDNSKKKKKSSSNSNFRCADWHPVTILSTIRSGGSSISNPIIQNIKQCWRQQHSAPFINFPIDPPSISSANQSDLLNKDGLARIMKSYGCRHQNNDNDDDCMSVVPETYHITHDKEACRTFFARLDRNQADKIRWLKKEQSSSSSSTEVSHGLVQDVKTELQMKYQSKCDFIGMSNNNNNNKNGGEPTTSDGGNDLLLQRHIKPYLIDGRTFHIRTYLLYKLASKTTNSGKNSAKVMDPPQAWFIQMGNIHLCSDLYFKIRDIKSTSVIRKCKEQGAKKDTMSFPGALTTIMSSRDLSTVMRRIQTMFGKVANAISIYHSTEFRHSSSSNNNNNNHHDDDDPTYTIPGEVSWLHFGADIILDSNLRPWLLELNRCPMNPLFGDSKTDMKRNPYISIFRLMMTHYRRQLLGNKRFDESICENTSDMENLVSRVL